MLLVIYLHIFYKIIKYECMNSYSIEDIDLPHLQLSNNYVSISSRFSILSIPLGVSSSHFVGKTKQVHCVEKPDHRSVSPH